MLADPMLLCTWGLGLASESEDKFHARVVSRQWDVSSALLTQNDHAASLAAREGFSTFLGSVPDCIYRNKA